MLRMAIALVGRVSAIPEGVAKHYRFWDVALLTESKFSTLNKTGLHVFRYRFQIDVVIGSKHFK